LTALPNGAIVLPTHRAETIRRTLPMPVNRSRRQQSLPVQVAELAAAVPQVVAHRITRMALAGPVLSARDRKEFSGMVSEKQAAFMQSWQGMFAAAVRSNQNLALAMSRSLLSPSASHPASSLRLAKQINHSLLKVASEGLRPLHRKATANAKRLARTKLR